MPRNKPHTEETKKKIGDANRKPFISKCDYCGKRNTTTLSQYNQKKRHFCNRKCYSRYVEEIMPVYEQPAWKGGISKENQRGRGSRKYRNWMEQVIEKYQGTCYLCGEESEECHHIKSWIDYEELRYEVSNGAALCKKCHYKVHYQNKELLK